ncbi:hypothetical protein TrispH2_010733 [Trichoplax sp. H2]|nr:hypothetical protein TrispH2_010733 [Trichoplax sp. H2]|eukprot:RDD37363.1 hypothetical protein TrispH2_010733 [Trichoplax sp. H2]
MVKIWLSSNLILSLLLEFLLVGYQIQNTNGAMSSQGINNRALSHNQTLPPSISWNKLKFRFVRCGHDPSKQYCSNYAIMLVNNFPNDGKMAANVLKLYNKLVHNGFRSSNIRVFYGNGSIPIEYSDIPTFGNMRLYPATSTYKRPFLRLIKQMCSCKIRSGLIYVSNPTSKDGSILLPKPSDKQTIAGKMRRVKLSANAFGVALLDCQAKDMHIIADQRLKIPDVVHEEYYERNNTRFYNVTYIGSLYYNEDCVRGDMTKRLIKVDWRYCNDQVVKFMKNPMYSLRDKCQPAIYRDWRRKILNRTLFGSRCGKHRTSSSELIPAMWC